MEQQQNELSAVIDELFANERTSMTTLTGVDVEFKRAGIVQLGLATKFINVIVERAPAEKVKQFIDVIAGEQDRLLSEGKSVFDVNLNAESVLTKSLNNHSLLLSVFAGMADMIPEFVAIFTTITEDQYKDLSLDEQLVIAAGVFIVNYGFFTQSLPPIIASVSRGLLQKRSEHDKLMLEKGGKQVAKVPARK